MSTAASQPEIDNAQRSWLVEQATRAPSIHNSQPWRFRWNANVVEIRVDLHRGIVSSDPLGREAVISCGAALRQLCLALRQVSLAGDVQRCPAREDPRLVARVTIRKSAPPSDPELRLFAASSRRHTHRGAVTGPPIRPELVLTLHDAARAAGAALVEVSRPGSVYRILHLARSAERLRSADPRDQAETQEWTPAAGSARRDGVPRERQGLARLTINGRSSG